MKNQSVRRERKAIQCIRHVHHWAMEIIYWLSSSSSFLGECIKLIRSSCVPPFNRMHLIVREFISPAISHNNRWVAAGRCHPTTRLLKTIRNETKIAFRAPLQCRLRNDNRAWHSENCRNETNAMCGDGSRETGATYVDDISINSYFTSICSRIACRTATYDDSKFSNRRRRENDVCAVRTHHFAGFDIFCFVHTPSKR